MVLDRRSLLAALALAPLGLASARAATPEPLSDPPLLGSDYRAARAGFRTRLLRRGPAPDEGDPLTAPDGAVALRYPSGPRELVAWASPPGDASARKPAVLVLHGGNAIWHGHWQDLAAPFVAAGFHALMPTMRGENGQPGDFSAFYDETDDVLAAAAVLRARPDVDPERVYISGHSIGGTLTLLGALAGDFRAAAALSPSPDTRIFFRRFADEVPFDISDPREVEMRSAVCFASGFRCPVLMSHGDGETRSSGAIDLTVARARAAGQTAEHRVVPGDHMGSIPGSIREALAFFARVG
ncbi:alpha/beta hydrolase family protein [Aureimonas phyllosphaerae]|uniref:Dipeptidyl aminopeptidase/acylaminoacyl peptidase n=1 Tax=Aureimonas phyllosphaerae TaxID=1166078 RepID=A0A7W6BLI9_9HYPH|nr:alpha/beta fold hydrolase [Aureimonas phyllosphaerae]MBB3934204.1 dipeptidyl aminopeptidase/acylaminoacyl peptidase [Aureimonas phyllosphaerae]MBB3958580.1 dipeptidyl aminopeptidase/acylaminoacyl peptidase [Aureimonas phyllosphaerae]SFE99173.1 Prolyl oligopeptidase family protein [Aureimonas phyllosphaerae]